MELTEEARQAAENIRIIAETMGPDEVAAVSPMIDGEPAGKNFLSMYQLTSSDLDMYFKEAEAAEYFMDEDYGIDLLPRREIRTVMRQPSTRTGGTMMYAMHQLGGTGLLISGMKESAEAKGESLEKSWEAFMQQAHIIATRTPEKYGPAFAAHVIARALKRGHIKKIVPVINLGDGVNEHNTQAVGDLFTINKELGGLNGVTTTVVGAHAVYRAFHSYMIGAHTMGMNVIAVESPASPVPQEYVDLLGDKMQRTDDLDGALQQTDVLYVGRRPDEYTPTDPKKIDAEEQYRQEQLKSTYKKWALTVDRMQQMPKDSILLDPRPIDSRDDFHPPEIDDDPRAKDVQQMGNMVPIRMAILATHLGKSILEHR